MLQSKLFLYRSFFSKENCLKLVLFLSACILSVDVWLNYLQMSGICATSSCRAVKEYVRLGESFLVLVGSIFFWITWIIVFFAFRYRLKILWYIVLILLLGALSFDGGLLGYQLIGIGENCWLCLGVGAALFSSMLLFSWINRSILILVLGITVWIGGGAANSVLKVQPQIPELKETAFIHRSFRNKFPSTEFYLFFSLHCVHCSKLFYNLAINKPLKGDWYLCCLDNRKKDLQRLSSMLKKEGVKDNPFKQILLVKRQSSETNSGLVSEELKSHVQKASAFFRSRGYTGVPTLVVREKIGRELVLRGNKNIVDYLRKKEIIKIWKKLEPVRKYH